MKRNLSKEFKGNYVISLYDLGMWIGYFLNSNNINIFF